MGGKYNLYYFPGFKIESSEPRDLRQLEQIALKLQCPMKSQFT
jgi:hypothetical protein